MSCPRVEHHTVYRVPLVGTDPRGMGGVPRATATPNIRILGSAAGDRNSYTGRPSSLKGILCISSRFFLLIEIFVLYRF